MDNEVHFKGTMVIVYVILNQSICKKLLKQLPVDCLTGLSRPCWCPLFNGIFLVYKTVAFNQIVSSSDFWIDPTYVCPSP